MVRAKFNAWLDAAQTRRKPVALQEFCHLPDAGSHFENFPVQKRCEFVEHSLTIIDRVLQGFEFEVFVIRSALGKGSHFFRKRLYLAIHRSALMPSRQSIF